MTELENAMVKELDVELNKSIADHSAPAGLRATLAATERERPAAPRPVAAPAPRPQTIGEQVQRLEAIEREIDARLRHENVEAGCEAERRITDAHAAYSRQLVEETARLERERDETIRQALDAYHVKMHELAALLRRRQ